MHSSNFVGWNWRIIRWNESAPTKEMLVWCTSSFFYLDQTCPLYLSITLVLPYSMKIKSSIETEKRTFNVVTSCFLHYYKIMCPTDALWIYIVLYFFGKLLSVFLWRVFMVPLNRGFILNISHFIYLLQRIGKNLQNGSTTSI